MADISKIQLPDNNTYNIKDVNAVTGSGTSGYLTKFNGDKSVTNGPALGLDTTKFLRNDGVWDYPSEQKSASAMDAEFPVQFIASTQTSGTAFGSWFSGNFVVNPEHDENATTTYAYLKLKHPDRTKRGVLIRSDGVIDTEIYTNTTIADCLTKAGGSSNITEVSFERAFMTNQLCIRLQTTASVSSGSNIWSGYLGPVVAPHKPSAIVTGGGFYNGLYIGISVNDSTLTIRNASGSSIASGANTAISISWISN